MQNKKAFWKIVFVISLALCGVFLAVIVFSTCSMFKSQNDMDDLRSEVIRDVSQITPELPDNPIDFDTLEKRNDDIYGWIEIPNTQVNYPIVQSWEEDDSFYLDHNIDKQYDINGSIYTEKLNNLSFTDPNTLIYGHNMLDGSMFQNLHKFRNKEFFNKNKYIYIYTRGHVLKYEIFAAYKSDNKHILNSYDFSDKKVYAEYLKNAQNPKSLEVNTRDCNLTTDDRIITLSTCIGNEKNYRYLVQGVLIDDTLTK